MISVLFGRGAALGHPTPNVDRIAKEGAIFTSWYGQASCTAGRASFITGRIPIRSALSIVVAPGDQNALRTETPTIAEFFKKNGYSTYYSGKWHIGDKPEFLSDRARLRRDEALRRLLPWRLCLQRHLQCSIRGSRPTTRTSRRTTSAIVNMVEWEGVDGQPAKKTGTIDYDYIADFDLRQATMPSNTSRNMRRTTSPSSWTSIS